MTGEPAALADLRARAAELSDLRSIGALMFWDQNTKMPPRGAAARADQLSTLERALHGRLTDPGLASTLSALAPWAADADPESLEAQMVDRLRRDHEKAVRVPTDLAAEMSHAAGLGQQAWLQARAAGDFAVFETALEHQFELRHRYAACFDGTGAFAHPYDVLLDDFEPGLTTAELSPLFAGLRDALVPLVAAAARGSDRPDPFAGAFPIAAQRAALDEVLSAVGFDRASWRLDETVHPFAQGLSTGDVRITTRWDEHDLGMSLFSVLHEFGHGLYEAQLDPALYRTTLGEPAGLGVHESQSRMWENLIGRSRPFSGWVLPILRRHLAGFDDLAPDELFTAVNCVRPSLVRTEADETTYNLHVVLRFELELALLEQRLEVRDLPEAWADGMQRLLGVEVPGPLEGVLQDVHWAAGLIGYFPTYTLGNLMTAQMWRALAADVTDVDERLARGDFGAVREWLGEHVHRWGRRLDPRELLRRATGEPLRMEPFLEYLRAKLREAGVLDVRDEQIGYYRALAPEYSDHALQVGGGEEVEAAVDGFRAEGDVLELACGPGTWTPQLLRHASSVTAVDASPEMLALARERVGEDPRVRFVQADLFEWRPDRRYDVVFFGFWLSHVPSERFDAFWATVASALRPGGRVLFVDDGYRTPDELVEGERIRRRLNDGSEHQLVKVPLEPTDLERRLRALGWDIAVNSSGVFFWGQGNIRSPA